MAEAAGTTAAAVVESPVPLDAAAPAAEVDFATFARQEDARDLGQPVPAPIADSPAAAQAPTAAAPATEPEPDETGPQYSPEIGRYIKAPKPAGVSKAQHIRNELLRTITEQEQALATTRPARPADAVAPPAPVPFDGLDPRDPRPTVDQFAGEADPYAAFLKAEIRWEDRVEQRKAQVSAQQTAAQTEAVTRLQTFTERMHAHAATVPDLAAKTQPIRQQLDPQGALARWITDSPVAPHVLLHLADHPEALAQLASARSLEAAARLFGHLEALFDPPTGASSPTPSAAAAAPAPKPTKTSTSAPPPVPALGARPAEPANRVAAAVANGDFAAFQAEEDARDLARAAARR